ncbi:hypothetical protein JNUCC74_11190 [Cerasibacillus sp. JNUCC 74]
MGMITFALVACSDDEEKTVKITKEAFNKLEEGMTIEEVKDIVGGKLREILEQMKLRECRGSCLDDPTGSVMYLY